LELVRIDAWVRTEFPVEFNLVLLSGDLLVQAYPICLILLEVSRIELTLKLSLALLVLFECDCFCSIPFFQVC
jgi:hypothetical protein